MSLQEVVAPGKGSACTLTAMKKNWLNDVRTPESECNRHSLDHDDTIFLNERISPHSTPASTSDLLQLI